MTITHNVVSPLLKKLILAKRAGQITPFDSAFKGGAKHPRFNPSNLSPAISGPSYYGYIGEFDKLDPKSVSRAALHSIAYGSMFSRDNLIEKGGVEALKEHERVGHTLIEHANKASDNRYKKEILRAALAHAIAAEAHKRSLNFNNLPDETKERYNRWSEANPEFRSWLGNLKKTKQEYLLHMNPDTINTLMYHSTDNPNLLSHLPLSEEEFDKHAEHQTKASLPIILPVKNRKEFQKHLNRFNAEGGTLGKLFRHKETHPYPPSRGQTVIMQDDTGNTIQVGRVHRVENEPTGWRIHVEGAGRSRLSDEDLHHYRHGYSGTIPPEVGLGYSTQHEMWRAGDYDRRTNSLGKSIGENKFTL